MGLLLMEWSIKSSSKQCAVSDVAFSGNDDVVCLVCLDPSGEINRFDVLKKNISAFSPPGKVLGQWQKRISSNKNYKINDNQRIAHYEEFFFSLFNGEKSKEKDILKQLFAFLLEKKRILKSFGRKNGENQKFIHVKNKTEFIVPVKDFLPEDLTSLENVFEMFI